MAPNTDATSPSVPPSTPTLSTTTSASASTSNTGGWTEPPWSGWIETTGDALIMLEAARRGLIPRVTRRLVDAERKMITSGSVFVFDEDESGIKRWTDGFFWSPSRILGNFLLYRETDKRSPGRGLHRRDEPAEGVNGGDNGGVEVSEHVQYNTDGVKLEGQTLSRPRGGETQTSLDRHRERTLVGSLTNSYKFKPDGLMKKTFSLTIGGVAQHLVSYYKVEDVEQGRLRSPSTLPELASLDISPEYLDKTHFRNPPKVEIGVDGQPRYRGEAEEGDDLGASAGLVSSPLSSGVPLLTEGRPPEGAKRSGPKRYEPYANANSNAKRKKNRSDGHVSESPLTSPTEDKPAPSAPSQPQPQTPQMHQAHSQSPPTHHPASQSPTQSQQPYPSTTDTNTTSTPPPPFPQYYYPPYAPPMYPTPAPAPTSSPAPALDASGQQGFYQFYPAAAPSYPGYAWPAYGAGAGYAPPGVNIGVNGGSGACEGKEGAGGNGNGNLTEVGHGHAQEGTAVGI